MSSRSLLAAAAVSLAVAGAPALARAQVDDTKVVEVAVGQQTTIPAANVRQYSEGLGGIADIRLPRDGSQFLVLGLRPGETTLLLILRDGRRVQYNIKVSAPVEQSVPQRENVRLDFYFVELSANSTYQIGIGWPASIGAVGRANLTYDLVAGELTSATALVTNQPLPRLDLLHATGTARIARQAALITANGVEASYESGGEVNLLVQGSFAAEIRRIEFGSSLRVLPRFDPDTGRMDLRIVADVSDLTDDRGTGVPGRTVSHVDTTVNISPGEAVLLAGVSGRSDVRSRAGLPWVSQIPILGILFGSHGGRSERTQNVLFIIPSVIDPVSTTGRRHIDDALAVFDRHFARSGGGLLGPQPEVRREPAPVPARPEDGESPR